MAEQKKLKFEDLQPHVDMLCDALENKGASPSGIPHNKEVADNAERYREVLRQIRSESITFEDLIYTLHLLNNQTLEAMGNNQSHRIGKIVNALDIFIMKEYNRVRNSK
jgi:hypothetical protein